MAPLLSVWRDVQVVSPPPLLLLLVLVLLLLLLSELAYALPPKALPQRRHRHHRHPFRLPNRSPAAARLSDPAIVMRSRSAPLPPADSSPPRSASPDPPPGAAAAVAGGTAAHRRCLCCLSPAAVVSDCEATVTSVLSLLPPPRHRRPTARAFRGTAGRAGPGRHSVRIGSHGGPPAGGRILPADDEAPPARAQGGSFPPPCGRRLSQWALRLLRWPALSTPPMPTLLLPPSPPSPPPQQPLSSPPPPLPPPLLSPLPLSRPTSLLVLPCCSGASLRLLLWPVDSCGVLRSSCCCCCCCCCCC
jgi:hypothetical protein